MHAADDLKALGCNEPTRLRCACAGRYRWVKTVDVKAEVDRHVGTNSLSYLGHEWGQRLVPARFGRHHPHPTLARPVEVLSGIAGCAEANLEHVPGVHQFFLDCPAEDCAVGNSLAKHAVIGVCMGIHVHQRHLAVYPAMGAKNWQGYGVIATHGNGFCTGGKQSIKVLLDERDGFFKTVGIQCNVTGIGYLEGVKGRRPGGHTVRPDQHRFTAYLPGPIARARAVAGTNIQRNPHQGHVQA